MMRLIVDESVQEIFSKKCLRIANKKGSPNDGQKAEARVNRRGSEKYGLVAAEGEKSKTFENCVVVRADGEFGSPEEVMAFAIANKAYEDNSDDEAGDDLFLVQFPGHEQESLNQDKILARFRKLRGQE